MRAQICPVCEGDGVVKRHGKEVKCNGCSGKGWVLVPDNQPPWYPDVPDREPFTPWKHYIPYTQRYRRDPYILYG